MHFEDGPATKESLNNWDVPWWKELTGYQWFVFIVASLGWLFDTMDQQLFNLARVSAVRSLLGVPRDGTIPAGGRDLRLMSPVKAVSDIPTGGKNLLIVAAVDDVLHFRIFDGDGKVVVDKDEKRLTEKAPQIEDLRQKLVSLWPPHELTGDEKSRVIEAVTSIVGHTPAGQIDEYAGYTTSIFMIGWALGGFFFGILGDRLGRAKTMILTVLCYSAFTGLSALSRGVWDFAGYRFLTGLGVGGQFAVGVSLVAEVMSDRARPFALGWLQALSAVGNMIAAIISMVLGKYEQSGAIGDAWRIMFLIGLAPAALAIPIFLRLKEPQRWMAVAREGEIPGAGKAKLGSLSELFGDPVLRRNTIVGMVLAFAGVVGLWGIGFFSFDLVDMVFLKHFQGQGYSAQEIAGKLTFWKGITSLVQNAGAFFGIYAFARVTHYVGRKPAFAVSFVLAAAATAVTFWFLDTFWQIFVLIPIMGFCQLALFGGYAIYFPELFPTRLRSTGTSFCYNVGRLVAAAGPSVKGLLTSRVFGGYSEPMRYAGLSMCAVFLVGLLALPFAPETRGRPLPE
jgi:MFS family permease